MATIQLPGLLTGLDTTSLISQLMAIERRTLTQYENRKTVWEQRQESLGTLETKLDALRSTVRQLSDASELQAFATTSSDTDILTAEASYNAFEGNHTVVINQLANAERWVHADGKKYAEDYVGAGTFIYSYNHTESVITTTETTTLEDLVGLINNDANNPGVTANLLYYNDAYHLVLNGNDAGSDYEVLINDSNTEVWQAESAFTVAGDNATLTSKIVDLEQFSGTLVSGEYLTISGKKHDGTSVSQNIAVTANTKIGHLLQEIDDVFGGAATASLVNGQIRLTDNTCGLSQMELHLSYNPGSGSSSLSTPAISQSTRGDSVHADLASFAQSNFTETQSAQDSQIRVDGYPPGQWITRSSNTIDDVIHGVTLHLHDTGTVQVNLTRDIAAVKDKLNTMVTAYNAAVTYIREKTGYNDVLKKAGVLMGDYVVSSVQNQLILPLITQTNGFVQDTDTFLTPGHVGLELDRDGVLSLSTSAFDEAIAKDYVGTLGLIGADKTGSSSSNTIQFYDADSSNTTAGEYEVQVTVAGGAIISAGIRLPGEPDYRDASYSGNIVTGNSTFDDNGDPIYPENGLQLSVDLSTNTTFYATVRVKQGFAGALEDVLDRMLKSTSGSIQIDQQGAKDAIAGLDEKIRIEEDRMSQRQERLTARFARMEKALALLQNQMAALGMSA